MASRHGLAYWMGLSVGWLLVIGWAALVAHNAVPYLRGASLPQPSDLLTRLVTLPGLPLPSDLAALAGWAITVLALSAVVFLVALTFSQHRAKSAYQSPLALPATVSLAHIATPEPSGASMPLQLVIEPIEQPPLSAPVEAATPHRVPSLPSLRESGAKSKVHRIFISHSSQDNDFGTWLVERLQRELGPDNDIWYDSLGRPGSEGLWESGIAPGTEWQEEILRAFREADIFLVILSPTAIASPWVRDELGMAWSRKNATPNIEDGLVVVPVLLENCETPPWLNLVQRVDFTGWRAESWSEADRAWAALLSAVRDTRTRVKSVELVGPPFDLALLPPLERFIGREQAVNDVIRLLTSPEDSGQQANVAAANGMGGIGKTALATEVARRLMSTGDFPDGIAVVDCRDQHGHVAGRALLRRALGRFTDGRKEPEADDTAALSDAAHQILTGKRALVILDNVEPDLPAAQLITPLRSAGIAVLTTSREPLPSVPIVASIRLDLLPEDEALALFRYFYGSDLVADDARAARVIVGTLGCHTLATKLAAANAAVTGRRLASIAHELETDPDKALLLENSEEAVLRVLSSSVASLSPHTRRLFVALASFATGDIERTMALVVAMVVAEVVGDPGQDATTADGNANASLDRLLSLRLADSTFLNSVEMPADSDWGDSERVHLHPLVRAYARSLLDGRRVIGQDARWTADQREQLQRLIARSYGVYLEKIYKPNRNNGYLTLMLDEANVIGALDWALAHNEDQAAAMICRGMGAFWRNTGRLSVGLKYLNAGALAAGRIAAQTQQRSDLLRLGIVTFFLGDVLRDSRQLDGAETVHRKNLDLFRAVGYRVGEGVTLNSLGTIALKREQLEQAEAHFQHALALHQELGDRANEAATLANLGTIGLDRGRLEEAEAFLEQSRAIRGEEGEPRSEGSVLANLAVLAAKRGQLEEAVVLLQQSLALLSEADDRTNQVTVLSGLGKLTRQLGWLEVAETYYLQLLTALRELGDRENEGEVLAELGHIAIERECLEVANTYYQQSLRVDHEMGNHQRDASSMFWLGFIAHRRNLLEDAEDYFQQSLADYRRRADQPREGFVLFNLGQVVYSSGRQEEAAEYFRQSLALSRELGEREKEARALANLGALMRELGRLEEAAEYSQQALALNRELGRREEEAKILNELALTAYHLQQFNEYEKYLRQGLAAWRELDNRYEEGATLARMGLIAQQRGHQDEAETIFQEGLPILRTTGDRSREGFVLYSLGTITRQTGRLEAAKEYYLQSLEIYRTLGPQEGVGLVLFELGQIELRRGRLEEAEDYLQQSLAIRQQEGDRRGEGLVIGVLGQISEQRGELELAEERYRTALTLEREAHDSRQTATMLELLGSLLLQHARDRKQGQQMLDAAIRLWKELGLVDQEERARETAREFEHKPDE